MKNYTKTRKLWVSLALLGLFGVFAAFLLVSGDLLHYHILGGTMLDSGFDVEPPVFSSDSSFSQEPFYLTLSHADGATIYYTLDCTDPDENAIRYEGPIWLEDASEQENVFCMRTDLSVGFFTDLIDANQTSTGAPGYTVPSEKVDKCNVVRAVAVDQNGNKSEIITKSYFVGSNFAKYENTNILSLVTDPSNLFDYETGIYVTGKAFDDYLAEGELNQKWQYWKANYRLRGKESERGCSVTIFDTAKESICQTYATMRVQGGYSRSELPRSLNLFAKADSEQKQTACFPALFGNAYTPSAITLASGGNRKLTKLNDVLMSDHVSELQFASMKYVPCVLFLEGEYWGFYWLTERYNEDYFPYYYGVDKNDVLMIKSGEVSVGDEKFMLLYENMKSFFAEADLRADSDYQKACELVDLESFLDYYAALIYIGRSRDWPYYNTAMWRTVSTGDGSYQDGKWRWMLFDCNSACMMQSDISHDTLQYVIERDAIFAAFWTNADFRAAFQEKILSIANGVLDAETVVPYIIDYQKRMDPLLTQSWLRFHGDSESIRKEYTDMFASNIRFFQQRKEVVEKWFS